MLRQGPSKARRAAATARSTSASLPSATVAMTCSVAGLRVLKVRPEADGTCWPSISSSRGLAADSAGADSRHNHMQSTSYFLRFLC